LCSNPEIDSDTCSALELNLVNLVYLILLWITQQNCNYMADSIGAAAVWTAQLVTGPLATALGVLFVALFGMSALTGNLDRARMVRIVLGLFVLMAASRLAGGISERFRGPGVDGQSASSLEESGRPEPDRPGAICWTCN
jgi:type IV secretory pathway VirB2 component (pilin)